MAELTGITSVEELEALSKKLKAQQTVAWENAPAWGLNQPTPEAQVASDNLTGQSVVGAARTGERGQSLTDILATRGRGRRSVQGADQPR